MQDVLAVIIVAIIFVGVPLLAEGLLVDRNVVVWLIPLKRRIGANTVSPTGLICGGDETTLFRGIMSLIKCGIRLAAWTVTCAAAFAQLNAYISSVVHAASYSDTIAPGSIFIVFGRGLGPQSLVQATQPLPLELQGTSVQVRVNNTTVSCPLLYVSSGQIAGVLPSNTPTGVGFLVVTVAGRSSYTTEVSILPSAFGVFTQHGTGVGAGSITSADYRLNTFSTPASRGQTVILWGTGLGAVAGDSGTEPAPGTSFDGVEVFIGNQSASVAYAGRSGCCVGLDQIAVEVPDGPQGCYIPVVVRRGGTVSNFVSLSVAPPGQTCTSDGAVPPDIFQRFMAGEQIRSGSLALGPLSVLQGAGFSDYAATAARLSATLKTKVSESDVRRLALARLTGDRRAAQDLEKEYGRAIAAAGPAARRALREAASRWDEMGVAAGFGVVGQMQFLTPLVAAAVTDSGTCTIVNRIRRVFRERGRTLDAGPALTYEGPGGRRTFTRNKKGQYLLSLGTGFSGTGLPAGYYQVSGTGGRDISAFSASLTLTAPLVWTNKAALATVDRSQPLTVTWSGGPASGHVMFGLGPSRYDDAYPPYLLICVEETRKGMLTVPPFALEMLFASSRTVAFLGPNPLDNRISIPGLDLAYISNGSADYRVLTLR